MNGISRLNYSISKIKMQKLAFELNKKMINCVKSSNDNNNWLITITFELHLLSIGKGKLWNTITINCFWRWLYFASVKKCTKTIEHYKFYYSTASFTDIDRCQWADNFESIFTTLEVSINKNWVQLKNEPPLSNLACLNRWNTLYQKYVFSFLSI